MRRKSTRNKAKIDEEEEVEKVARRSNRTRRRKKSDSSSPDRDSESEEEVMPTPRTRRAARSVSEERGVPSTPSGSRTRRSSRRIENIPEETKPEKETPDPEETADRDSNGSNDAEADSSTVWKVQNSNGSGSGIAKLKLCRSGPIDEQPEPAPPLRRGRGAKHQPRDDLKTEVETVLEDDTSQQAEESAAQASPTPEPDSSGLAAKPGQVTREEEESKEESSSSEKSHSPSPPPPKIEQDSGQEEEQVKKSVDAKRYAEGKIIKQVKASSPSKVEESEEEEDEEEVVVVSVKEVKVQNEDKKVSKEAKDVEVKDAEVENVKLVRSLPKASKGEKESEVPDEELVGSKSKTLKEDADVEVLDEKTAICESKASKKAAVIEERGEKLVRSISKAAKESKDIEELVKSKSETLKKDKDIEAQHEKVVASKSDVSKERTDIKLKDEEHLRFKVQASKGDKDIEMPGKEFVASKSEGAKGEKVKDDELVRLKATVETRSNYHPEIMREPVTSVQDKEPDVKKVVEESDVSAKESGVSAKEPDVSVKESDVSVKTTITVEENEMEAAHELKKIEKNSDSENKRSKTDENIVSKDCSESYGQKSQEAPSEKGIIIQQLEETEAKTEDDGRPDEDRSVESDDVEISQKPTIEAAVTERVSSGKLEPEEEEEQSDDEPLVELAPGSPDEPDPEMAEDEAVEAEQAEKAYKRKSRHRSGSSSSRSSSSESGGSRDRTKRQSVYSASDDSEDARSPQKRPRGRSSAVAKQQTSSDNQTVESTSAISESKAQPTHLRRIQMSPKPQRERIVLRRTFSDRRVSTEEPGRKEEASKDQVPEPDKIKTEEDKENLTNHSPPEEEPLQSDQPVIRKRRWGSSKSIMKKTVLSISSDPLKNLIPDAKPVPASEVHLSPEEEEGEVLEDDSADHGKTDDRLVDRPVPPPQIKPVPPPLSDSTRIVVNSAEELQGRGALRKLSVVNDSSKSGNFQHAPSFKHRPSCILYITNLVRPFTVGQLKELLSRTGKIVEGGFWVNSIKSQCYVEYEDEDQAIETRHALHGVRWPITNRKQLYVEFARKDDVLKAQAQAEAELAAVKKISHNSDGVMHDVRDIDREERSVKVTPAVREWDLGKVQDPMGVDVRENRQEEKRRREEERRLRKEKRSATPSHDGPSHKIKKKEEEPAAPVKLLDDLFRKTKTTPCIYWLPLTAEQIAEKEEMRRKHMAQHERLRAEMRKAQERNHGRERERDRDRNRERDRRDRRRGSRDK